MSRLVYPDGHLGWLVGSFELAREVLRDERWSAAAEGKRPPVRRPSLDPFFGGPPQPGWFVDMDEPRHTALRRRITPYFTRRRIESDVLPQLTQIVRAAVAAISDPLGQPARRFGADLVKAVSTEVPSQTMAHMLHLSPSQRETLLRESHTLFSLSAPSSDVSDALTRTEVLIDQLIRERRLASTDDFLNALLWGSFPDDEVVGATVLVLTAGLEATAGAISFAILAALDLPAGRREALADPSFRSALVEESLRHNTIFHLGVPRVATTDIQLGGHVVSAGTTMTVALPAANRDPDRFSNPDTFWPTRDEGSHLAFGHGAHQCLGQHLARLQINVVLEELFGQHPGLRLAEDRSRLVGNTDSGLYGLESLPVTW